jgi:ABC-2 type transport system ATP-binding protein
MNVAEKQDRFKRPENVESASESNLESEQGSVVALRSGLPVTPISSVVALRSGLPVTPISSVVALRSGLPVTPISDDGAVPKVIVTPQVDYERNVLLRPVDGAVPKVIVTPTALKTKNLMKKMGNLLVVDNLNLEIRQNEVLGLLGPNGAGKTTSIKMMVGLLNPTSGQVLFDGAEEGFVDKRRIGVCPQNLVNWDALTCRENLIFMGDMYGVPAPQLQVRVNQLLDRLSLTEKADQAAAKLSGGVKRRLNIALSLVHDPEIVFLDEPSAGLDPQSRILLWEFIQSLRDKEGKTIVLTTHDMEEADALSDRIAILDHGKLLCLDTPEGLKNTLGKGDTIELQLSNPTMSQEMLAQIKSMDGIEGARELSGKIAVRALDAASKLPKIIRLIERAGEDVIDIAVRRNSLEDVFVSLTGRALRE